MPNLVPKPVYSDTTGRSLSVLEDYTGTQQNTLTLEEWKAIPFYSPSLNHYATMWQVPVFELCQFTKDRYGFVILRGLMGLSGTFSLLNNDVIAVLPEGYRPRALELFIVSSSAGGLRIDIGSDGSIRNGGGTLTSSVNTYISFGGIRFHTPLI